jgi:sugar lactone lactonase YvrE
LSQVPARLQEGSPRPAARTWKRSALATLALIAGAGIGATMAVGSSGLHATASGADTPVVFMDTGSCVDDTYVVPPGISALNITAIGSAGQAGSNNVSSANSTAGGAGGLGSMVEATVPVTTGSTIYVNVAANYDPDFNSNQGQGGGPGSPGDLYGPANIGGGGGSATWISTTNPVVGGNCDPNPSNLLVVAAGGGGGGAAGVSDTGGGGGSETVSSGNGDNADNNNENDGGGGGGASATTSGPGGPGGHATECASAGAGGGGGSLQGGPGGNTSNSQGCEGAFIPMGSGGGGGGGYYGGGGGGGGSDNFTGGGGGGGGGAGVSAIIAGGTYNQATTTTHETPEVEIVPNDTPPAFTAASPTSGVAVAGQQFTTTVDTTGYPTPEYTNFGNLPSGLNGTDNQDGTATISGTPDPFTGGVYHLPITVQNTDSGGTNHTATSNYTLTVDEAPQWDTDQNADQFSIGSASTYTYQSFGGYPAPTVSESGTLPAGVHFTDDGKGDAVVSGTPTGAAGGVYPITFTASSGVGLSTTEHVSLSVYPLPTTVTVQSTANPSTPGQQITLSASTNPTVGAGQVMQFTIDGHVVTQLVQTDFTGTASLPPMATSSWSALGVGTHTITAKMLNVGEGYAQSISAPFTETVTDSSGAASGTSVSASPVPAPDLVSYSDNNGLVVEKTASSTSVVGVNPTDRGLAVDAAGDIYTVGTDEAEQSQIQETTPSGTTSFIGQPFGDVVEGLAVDPDGDVFVANDQELVEMTSGGSSRVLESSGATATTFEFGGIATDAAGDVFWTDDYDGNPTSTSNVYELPAPYYNTPPELLYSGTDQFAGLAVDAAGDVFVGDTTADKVVEVAPGGATTTAESGGVPSSVAVDAAGNLYVGLTDVNKVVELTRPYSGGAGTTVMTGHTPAYLAAFEPPTTVTTQQPVPLSATEISAPVGGTPTGTVTFKDGATVLGTGSLNAGSPDTASLTLPAGALSVGPHTITAVYGGSGSWPSSTSTVLTVNVISPTITVPVTGSQIYGGAPSFSDTPPPAPAGVTIGGTLTGCQTSLTSTAFAGFHSGTISGCGGLTLTGPNAAYYSIAFSDNGFSVAAASLAVNVTGSEPYSGHPTFAFTAPGTLPGGISGVAGTLAGCATTVASGDTVGNYQGTMTGCTGLTPTGANGSDYHITYTDGGFNVVPATVTVTVTGAQPYLGTPTFTGSTPGTLPSGITGVTGTLTGCVTSEPSSAAAGTYQGTITGCTGETPAGSNAAEYVVGFADGGLTITPLPLAVTVIGTRPLGGGPTFQYAQPATLPTGVISVTGALSGCATSTTVTTSAGTYPGTITACGGLSAAGADGVDYAVTYTDGGFTVFTNPTGTSLAIAPETPETAFIGESGRYGAPAQIAKLVSPYGGSNVSTYFNSGAYNPGQLAVDAAGDVFVSDLDFYQQGGDSGDKVYEVTPSGAVTTVATGLNQPGGVAVDHEGDVFIADTNNHRIVEVTAGGVQSTVMSGIGYPEGVAVDAAGDLFVAEQGPDEILEQALPYSSAPTVLQTVPYPQAVAVDQAGDLFVANGQNGPAGGQDVEEFAPPYTSHTTVVTSGQVANPDGLSVDAAGNLWISDYGNIVYELTAPGQAGSTFNQKYNANSNTTGVSGVGVETLPTSVIQGQTVTFSSTVISSPAGASPPGSVNFTDGGTLLGTATLNGGTPDTATFSTSSLGVGAHTITATYGGGAGYPASTSELGTVMVYSPTVDVAVSATQTYGGAPTFTATEPGSLPPGVTVSGTLTGCGTSLDTTAAPGTYPGTISACSGLSLAGANAGSYTLAYVDSGLTVQALSLTVPVTGTQSYGGAPNFTAGSPVSLPSGITGVTGTLTGCGTSVDATTAPGSYPETITGCGGLSPTGSGAADYAVTYTDGGFTVTPAPITVTVTGTQPFGGTTTTFTDQAPALLPTGITITGSLSGCTSTATATTPVGTYPASISGCGGLSPSGGTSADYAVVYDEGPTTVTALTLPVIVTGTQTYGGAPTFGFSAETPLPTGISGVTDSLSSCVTAETAAAPVSSYAGTISGCSGLSPLGPDAADYTVTYTGGSLTVTPATLAIVPADQSGTYGGTEPTFTYAVLGLENGDSQASALTADPTCAPGSTAPGLETISCTGGTTSANYVLDETATANYQVAQAPLTITADDQSSTYGAALPTLTASFGGLTNGDSATSLTTAPICTTTATASSPAGIYPITCSGAVDSNYAITYTAGTLTVGQAPLTITADDQSSTYGAALPTLTASFGGLTNGDSATSLTTAPTCTTTATASSDAGPYPITCSGAVDSNYAITYTAGTLTVGQAPLTITADDQSSTYGAALPTLTASFGGLTNGDSATSLTTAPTCTTTATASSDAGPYPITCSGAVDSNYAITYTAGTLTLGQAPLTITPDNQTVAYGAPDPAFTYAVSGLEHGDNQATALTTDPTCSVTPVHTAAGSYPISCSGAATTDANYSVVESATGTLTVSPPPPPPAPPGSVSSQSATSNSSGGTASATNDATTVAANGEGSLTVSQYGSDPVSGPTFSSAGGYVDVEVASGSSFSSLTVNDCNLGGGSGLEWFNQAANGGTGAWQPVLPTPTYTAGPPACVSMTLNSTTSPALAQLTGTVFGVSSTLIQGNPTSATVAHGGGYSGQLTVTNATGAATYTETSSAHSTDVVVTSTGAISAATSLAPGTYTVSGTDTDTNGDTGTWNFTLTISPATPTPTTGYWEVASDGGIFSFGDAGFFGSTGGTHLNKPIVGMATTPDGKGYWLVASDGGIFDFGDAGFFGSMGGGALNSPIVGMATTPDGKGYWLVASDGGIFSFGDAGFFGSTGGIHLNKPIVGMATTPDGKGYWLVASDGGIFGFGDAGFFGSMGGGKLNSPIVGMATTPDGKGYWLVASDGGIFSFGDAGFFGSMGGTHLNEPIMGMATTPDGKGYRLVASDGGIFGFGDAGFFGSMGGGKLNSPIVGMAAS